jgi:hypothetical protein
MDSSHPTRVSRSSWKSRPNEPIVLYMGELGSSARELLPQFFLIQGPDHITRIRWNSARDLSASKMLHTSLQPFYLRRYARRVAELWEKQHGRNPRVNAQTEMSLNGRPYQELVDPEADLATVSARWWRHNDWIRDLQVSRIPRQALAKRTI